MFRPPQNWYLYAVGRLFDQHQAKVLTDRYLDIMFGSPGGLLVWILQGPMLGTAIAGVWVNLSKDDLTLYFVLALSAFFLGAVNSAREIVKERLLFQRERLFNLKIGSYLWSKAVVLLTLGGFQSVFMTVIVARFVHLQVGVVWTVLVLWAVSSSGVLIGLLVSASVRSSDRALAAVPLIVIPQILFSERVIGPDRLANWTGHLQKLMPVHWGYRLLETLKTEDDMMANMTRGILALAMLMAAAAAATLVQLSRQR